MLNVKNIDSDMLHNFNTYESFDAMPPEMAAKCMMLDAAQDNEGKAVICYLGSRNTHHGVVYHILSTHFCRVWMNKHGATVVSMKEE